MRTMASAVMVIVIDSERGKHYVYTRKEHAVDYEVSLK
jgi:hypothetical protein